MNVANSVWPTADPQFKLQWGDDYPLISLGLGRDDQPLPGELTRQASNVLSEYQAVVFFAERKAGVASLLRWWRGRLERPSVVVRAATPSSSTMSWTRMADDSTPTMNTALASFLSDPSAGNAEHLFRAVRELGEVVHLFVTGLDAIEDANKARSIMTQLRVAVEAQIPLRIAVATASVPVVADAFLDSGFISVAQLFRLAPFREDEVGALCAAMGQPGKSLLTEEAQRRLIDVTGGQPLLVDRALVEIRRRVKSQGTSQRVGEALDAIRRTPPEVVKVWQNQLRECLRGNIELRRALETYVENNTISDTMPKAWPPPARERGLFFNGWVGCDRFGRWGIRSPLHQEWARPVLSEGQGDTP